MGHRRPCPAPEATILKASWRQRQRAEFPTPKSFAPVVPAGPQVQGAVCPRRVQSRVPNWKGGKGRESQGCWRHEQEVGPRENRICVWRDWTRGEGQRKKQPELGLGGNSDLGLQNPLQGIPGTLLHQEGPGPRACTSEAKQSRPHSPAHRGPCHRSPLTPHSSLHSDLRNTVGRGKILLNCHPSPTPKSPPCTEHPSSLSVCLTPTRSNCVCAA